MARTKTQIIALASAILQDTGNDVFTETELGLLFDSALEEMSGCCPYKAKAEVTTTADSRDITISAEDKVGLIRLTGKLDDTPAVEYPVDQDPPSYHNVKRFGDTVTMLIDSAPASAEDAYLFLAKVHTVSEEASTLGDPRLETLLAEIIAGKAAASKAALLYQQATDAKDALSSVAAVINRAGPRITQAVNDIDSGRTELGNTGDLLLSSSTAIGNISDRITQAVADIASGRTEAGKVAAIITSGATALAGVAARITQAVTDIGSGRTGAGESSAAITDAETEIGKISTELDLAAAALVDGESIINTVPVGGGAPEYMSQANSGVNVARGRLAAAQGYLQQANTQNGTNATYMALAAREIAAGLAKLQEANGSFNQAKTEESISGEYRALAIQELNAGNAHLSTARAYINQAQVSISVNNGYLNSSAGEIRAANEYLSQAYAQLRVATSRLNIAAAGQHLNRWGNETQALALNKLNAMVPARTYTRYPL